MEEPYADRVYVPGPGASGAHPDADPEFWPPEDVWPPDDVVASPREGEAGRTGGSPPGAPGPPQLPPV
ncbi:MAG TPA: hypothetical protein VES42_06880, partial [Pilimelia sp.]|nr:hypothetical protein [Pilimelia sp.]